MKLPYACLPDDVWLYKLSDDKQARYGLGRMKKNGKNLLVCIGSTPTNYAKPNLLDPTVAIVDAVAKKYRHDGWVMFNLYPEKNPDWDKLSSKSAQYHTENIKIINRVFSALCEQYKDKIIVWAAWGAVVETRPYLKECLKDILTALEDKRDNIAWKHIGTVTKNGVEHPGQPNPFRPKDAKKLTAFKIYGKGGYIEALMETETRP